MGVKDIVIIFLPVKIQSLIGKMIAIDVKEMDRPY
jgi:hypothetical protein